MSNKQTIYIISDYRAGAADGLAEFNYQTVNLLKDEFNFNFIEFRKNKPVDYYDQEVIDGFPIHTYGIEGLSAYQVPALFIDWLKKIPQQDTLFHLHHIWNLRNLRLARALHKNNFRYIITPHDSYVYSPSFMKLLPPFKKLYKNLYINIVDKYILDHATFVHGISEQCPPYLKSLTKTPVEVVTNQVKDMKLEFNVSKIKPQVCFIGRFNVHSKGIDLSLKAFQLFKKANKHNTENVVFKLIGPADAAASQACDTLCQELGLKLGQDVIFAGKIPVEERNQSLVESKVYMQLSRMEGFGLSIAQALTAYKPVIISSQVPIHDKITKHGAGYVVNNPQEAADALAAIFALSPDKYLEMAMSARRCYEQEFHPEVIKPQLINLYTKSFRDNSKKIKEMSL